MRHGRNATVLIKHQIDAHLVAASRIVRDTGDMRLAKMACAMRVGGETQYFFLVQGVAHLARYAASASGVSISISGASSAASTSRTRSP